jgi:hypothetical protein
MRTTRSNVLACHLGLLFAVAGCAAMGCSANADSESGSATSFDTTAADAGPADGGTGTPAPKASQLVADLTAIGLDPHALPKLDSLEPAKLKKVMKTFTKALGVQCTGCHDPSDFSLSTPNKRIAARMWSDFVEGLAFKDGSVLYCDSCHGGQAEFLDRSDKPKLRQWMSDNFVDRMKRTDGADHGCKTCHGDPFDGDVFKDVWHAE